MRHFLLLCIATIIAGCSQSPGLPPEQAVFTASSSLSSSTMSEKLYRTTNFPTIEKSFKFSADIPASWQSEFVPQITAINIYNPDAAGTTNLERSQIFIRQFRANQFLTLPTVDISKRTETTLGTHAVVEYEITKKPGVADFALQPAWRNTTHRVTDIRYATTNPSLFYVFARSPDLPEATFQAFINSLRFADDQATVEPPISRFNERVTKKPFGIHITKADSPIQPERFAGYHTGTDFEMLPGEEEAAMKVKVICTGPVVAARQADGYGGVMVQSCVIDGETVTVLYGHIAFSLSSIQIMPGTHLEAGQTFATLGTAFSDETDGERRHLHLSIHKGTAVVLAGYVQSEKELDAWVDPMTILSRRPEKI